jgi:competence transcription factor ComK
MLDVCENPLALLYPLALHGLYNNMSNNGWMQYPLLPTRKSVVTLLNARRIDFHMSLVSLQGQVLEVETYRMSVVCMTKPQSAEKAPFIVRQPRKGGPSF